MISTLAKSVHRFPSSRLIYILSKVHRKGESCHSPIKPNHQKITARTQNSPSKPTKPSTAPQDSSSYYIARPRETSPRTIRENPGSTAARPHRRRRFHYAALALRARPSLSVCASRLYCIGFRAGCWRYCSFDGGRRRRTESSLARSSCSL